MAQHIKVDGTVTEVTPKNGVEFTVDEIREYIGGYLEGLTLNERLNMYLDEQGFLKGKLPNVKAMEVLQKHRSNMGHVTIVGDVLVADISETGDDED